jgi:phage tail sheath protein FI
MAEEVFKSPGVSTKEIDLSGPRRQVPVGTPAGVIGTALEGPAFVPVTVGSFSDFVTTFGSTDGEKFGPLAVYEWLKNATSCTYLRVLGVGNGKKRDDSTGKVTSAGFVVGETLVQDNGLEGNNPYASATSTQIAGRTYFLGAYMKDASNSTYLQKSGIQPVTSASLVMMVNHITGVDGRTIGFKDPFNGSYFEAAVNTSVAKAAASAYVIAGSGVTTPGQLAREIMRSISIATGSTTDNLAPSRIIQIEIDPLSNDAGGEETDRRRTLRMMGSGESGNVIVSGTLLSAGNVILSGSEPTDAGYGGNFNGGGAGAPVLRGVLMAPQGVTLALSTSNGYTSSPPASDTDAAATPVKGWMTGSVEMGSKQFVMLLNGHKGTDASNPNVITASFDMSSGMYFADVFNSDPFKIEQAGHLLYTTYDIHSAVAVVTGAGILNVGAFDGAGGIVYEEAGFLTTGSLSRNTTSAYIPNYESFEERYQTAVSPSVISQKFGGEAYSLFKVWATDDGSMPRSSYGQPGQVKISIENISPSNTDANPYGSFDVLVRDLYDTDEEKKIIERYNGVNLDTSSTRYIGRAIGDQRTYFDWDQTSRSQKLVTEGDFPVVSNYVRVQVSDALKAGEVPGTALPLGFRGPSHIITSGSNPLTTVWNHVSASSAEHNDTPDWEGTQLNSSSFDILKRTTEMPIPYRETIAVGESAVKKVNPVLTWGVKSNLTIDPLQPNKSTGFDRSIWSFTRFFPSFNPTNFNFMEGDNPGKADVAGTVRDCDAFNNNKFTLENVSVRTGSDGRADPLEWSSASYARDAKISIDVAAKTRAFTITDLKTVSNRNYAKFTFFLQGGFNGVNIFDEDKSKLLSVAAKREIDDETAQGGTAGPTVSSYRKAIDIMGTKSDVDIKLLAIPGIRHSSVTDYAIDSVESRFDAMYIMDIEERDTVNTVVTSSGDQQISVQNTVSDFKNRALNSSFAAAYFPDVVMTDPMKLTNVRTPPSVSVLGAFALNDVIGHPWFAPAGFTRGTLSRGLFASVDLNKTNLDDLYEADINPITDFPGTGLMVFGQKTLLATQSALDRVNVRRLLIEIRRRVRAIANTLLFEPNRTETLDKFSSLVNPVLQSIQDQSGLDRFKVIIDSSTTTQADIENNTIRGKIYVQPTRTAEFISLDFVVTNAGTEI